MLPQVSQHQGKTGEKKNMRGLNVNYKIPEKVIWEQRNLFLQGTTSGRSAMIIQKFCVI